MAITKRDFDSWTSILYGLPFSLYSYFLDIPTSGLYSSVIGATGDYVFSVMYTPYLEKDDLELYQIQYDSERFGKLSQARPQLPDQVDVFRIHGVTKFDKELKTLPTYKVNKSIGGRRNWRNESKLYQYPYSFMMLYDGVNQPITLKPQLCESTIEVRVKTSISDKCSSSIYVRGYKGDNFGVFEGMVSGGELELPCTSNNYTNFIARSKNQTKQNVEGSLNQLYLNDKINKRNLGFGIGASAIKGVGSLLSGNIGGAIGSVGDVAQNLLNYSNTKEVNALSRENVIKGALAEIQDLRSMPNTLISKGDNVFYGVMNNEGNLSLYRYGVTENFGEILGNYFAMYGYLQNRIMKVNTKSRYYYNYISSPNINLKSYSIPQMYLNRLKKIFEGVTIWHLDNEGVEAGNYEYDNKEV